MITRTDKMRERYSIEVSNTLIRRVWAEITRTPQVSCRELEARMGTAYSSISAAIRFLVDCGYVEAEPRTARSRRVLVPFYVGPLHVTRKDEAHV